MHLIKFHPISHSNLTKTRQKYENEIKMKKHVANFSQKFWTLVKITPVMLLCQESRPKSFLTLFWASKYLTMFLPWWAASSEPFQHVLSIAACLQAMNPYLNLDFSHSRQQPFYSAIREGNGAMKSATYLSFTIET